MPTIVIDPGHGGADNGVVGQNGVTEKYLAMDLAQRIADHLRGRYRVRLTRTSDIGMSLDERPGMANNERAAAFISLHAGGSLDRTLAGATLFYYTGGYDPAAPAKETAAASYRPWRDVQKPHRPASTALANRIKARLDAPPAVSPAVVADGPLRVLMGADMPAVVIEVGYITNPVEEKRLADDAYLDAMSRRIAQGIDDFFNIKDTISTTNLSE